MHFKSPIHPLLIQYQKSRYYSSENELFRVFNDP